MDEKNENNRKAKRESDHQKDVKELMRLWILKLQDELYGQNRAFRTRTMELMNLWIQKLKVEADEEEARTAAVEWEYENNMLRTEGAGEGEYDWEFQYEHT
jgi:hypothetical protein